MLYLHPYLQLPRKHRGHNGVSFCQDHHLWASKHLQGRNFSALICARIILDYVVVRVKRPLSHATLIDNITSIHLPSQRSSWTLCHYKQKRYWCLMTTVHDHPIHQLQFFPLIVTPDIVTNCLLWQFLSSIRDPEGQFCTAKSLVIVTFAYWDTFLWSQQCHYKRQALYYVLPCPGWKRTYQIFSALLVVTLKHWSLAP